MDGPTGETVIFFREDAFYPVQLSGLKSTAEEVPEHVALNPGTVCVEDLSGNRIWPVPAGEIQ